MTSNPIRITVVGMTETFEQQVQRVLQEVRTRMGPVARQIGVDLEAYLTSHRVQQTIERKIREAGETNG